MIDIAVSRVELADHVERRLAEVDAPDAKPQCRILLALEFACAAWAIDAVDVERSAT